LRDEQRTIFEQNERVIARTQASLKRIQITWRNIELRAQKLPGAQMPDDLSAALDALELEKNDALQTLRAAQAQKRPLAKQLESVENDVRLSWAEIQRMEGQKEGLLLAHEGSVSDQARELDRALDESRSALAGVGRVIFDLRGEVPVSADLRRQFLSHDAQVLAAATNKEFYRRALSSMDADGFFLGKMVLIGSVVLLFALILWSAVF
jgi:chromosome segregation ATPase